MLRLLLSILLMSCTLSAQLYKATPLTSLGKGSPQNGLTVALGVNNSGIVVGTSETPTNSRHACYWSTDGTIKDLGTLGGNYGVGFAINNLGQVAGSANVADNSRSDPFLWTSSGGMQDLGRLGSGIQNEALALNDKTHVVGFSCLDSGNNTCHAFLWIQSTGMQDLGTLGGSFSTADGINAAGHIAGWSARTDGTRHAFLWTAAGGMQELEPGSTFESFAFGINDSDEIIGEFINPTDSQFHAFMWTQTSGLRDLGVLTGGWSEALGINDSGNVVGFSRDASGKGYGTIWRDGGAIQKLGLLASVGLNAAATGINKSGQIAANGATPYLLTPTWVKLSAQKINFGSVSLGQQLTKRLVLTNLGTAPLTIHSITVAGTNATDFAEVNTCGSLVPAQGKCFINVTFMPKVIGTRTASLNIADSDRASPQSVNLTGNGI